MNKNEIYRTNITAYSHEGSGIGKIDGQVVFIPAAAKDDLLDVKILKVNKNHAFAKVEKIITPSKHRAEPLCPVYLKCGGCQLMHLDYSHQLEIKRQTLEDALKKIGGLNLTVPPVIKAESPFNYRNKAQFPVGESKDGKVITGFYACNSKRIVEYSGCHIVHPNINKTAEILKDWMNAYKITAYNQEMKKGLIRHFYIRTGIKSGELMAVIVSRSKKIPFLNELLESLISTETNIKSVYINVNKADTNVVLGSESILVYGNEKIKDSLKDISFNISPKSFFQINPVQTEILYETALDFLEITKDDVVFDLYSGIGTISLFIAKYCKEVYGIEIVNDAVLDAKENAKRNGIKNAFFLNGDVSPKVRELMRKGINPKAVILDPPRKGCDESLLKLVLDIDAKKIVYISCSPQTLARDLKYLCQNGYEAKKVQPVDLFPNTYHVETIVLLRRQNT